MAAGSLRVPTWLYVAASPVLLAALIGVSVWSANRVVGQLDTLSAETQKNTTAIYETRIEAIKAIDGLREQLATENGNLAVTNTKLDILISNTSPKKK